MASLSSLFIGQQPQQQPQAAAVTTQELPKQIAPYYEKLLKEAEALYKQKMEAGAPIYEGKTIAGYTPEQEQLFSGLQSLQGTQAPKFAEAEALTRGTTAKVTPDEVQEYMNPYQQAVVDIEKREAEKQYQSTVVPQLAAQAAAAGSFGGSRQGILEGMASEANQRLQADIQAKGSAQAYQDAMSLINQQRQREGAAAGQLAQLAPAGFAAQAQELGAIGKVGDAKQQQQQLALDEAYKQYMQEQQFPSESLKEYQSYVQSFPNIPTQITRAPEPQSPGLAQSLLGLGTTALGTYGAFGGFSPGGFMGMKNAETGGGISGLPVVQAKEGKNIGQSIRDYFGFGDPDKSTAAGRVIGGTVRDIGGIGQGILDTATLPGRYLYGDKESKPTVGGVDFSLEDLLKSKPPRAFTETKEQQKERVEDEAFDKEAEEANRKVREQGVIVDEERRKGISMDPITDEQAQAARDANDKLAQQQAYLEALEQEKMLEQQLQQTQKNTPEETAIKSQIAQLKEAYSKIGDYKAPDISGVTSAMGDVRKVKQDVISSLGKEKQEIRDEELSGFGQAAIAAGQAVMKAPNLITAITDGLAAAGTVGKKATDTARSKKKANKEKAQAITLEIANDKVAEQQFILSMKTDADAKKAQRILNKIKAGATISTAESNFMNAQTNRINAESKKILAEYEATGAKKLKEVKNEDIKRTTDIMKTNAERIYKDKNNIAEAQRVLGISESGFKKTVNKLKLDKTFIEDISRAWESALAQGTASGYAANEKDRFVSDMIIPYLQRRQDLVKKAPIKNFISNVI